MSSPDSKPPQAQPVATAAEAPPPVQSGGGDHEQEEEEEEEEEEEKGECGFCLYMKAGECRDAFTDWEKCIEEAEKNKEDLFEKCGKITAVLKECMVSHSDYYEPILRAEKVAENQAIDELEKEKEAEAQSEQNAPKDGASTSNSNSNDQK